MQDGAFGRFFLLFAVEFTIISHPQVIVARNRVTSPDGKALMTTSKISVYGSHDTETNVLDDDPPPNGVDNLMLPVGSPG